MQYWMKKRKNELPPSHVWYQALAVKGRDRLRRALRQAASGAALILMMSVTMTPPDAHAEVLREVSLDQVTMGSLLLKLPVQSAGAYLEAPTLDTDIDLSVAGEIARATLTQTFVNPTDDWVEATYVFPLPDDAAVDHMELMIGERRIVGEIHRRKAAKQIYQQARRSGRKAALLSQERPNLFTTAVANIAPQEQVRVSIQYQQNIERQDDRYHLRIPLTLTPRYIPGQPVAANADKQGSGWMRATDEVPDASRITPPLLSPDKLVTDHRVSLRASIDAGQPLLSLTSRYHPIDVNPASTHRYDVAFSGADELLDHDIELVWQMVPGNDTSAAQFTHRNSEAGYLLTRIMPPTGKSTAAAVPRCLILVIDTSGSMQGVSMTQAIAAAIFAVGSLSKHDRFNVIEFDDQATALFDTAQPADKGNRSAAVNWLQGLQADGGTNMAPALNMALREQATGFLQQVLFVTDGAVGNEEALFQQIARDLGHSRLFTVGIGSAPNGWFMRKAAELGRGSETTISAVGEVESRMRLLFKQLAQPVLTDIEINWGDANVEHYPKVVSDLYAGQPIDVLARFGAVATTLDVEVTATHWVDGKPTPWRKQLAVDWHKPAGPGVAVAWARRKIDALGDARRRGADANVVRESIAEVALAHHLVSEATSLVAVDHTPERSAADLLKRRNVANLAPFGTPQQALSAMVPTATSAAWHRLIGSVLILLALFGLLVSRIRGVRHAYL